MLHAMVTLPPLLEEKMHRYVFQTFSGSCKCLKRYKLLLGNIFSMQIFLCSSVPSLVTRNVIRS